MRVGEIMSIHLETCRAERRRLPWCAAWNHRHASGSDQRRAAGLPSELREDMLLSKAPSRSGQ